MSMLAWLATKITGEAIRTGGEVAKTATEIPKNLVETRKARLEVEELKLQKAQRENLITPATFEQVKEYDPKVALIKQRLRSDQYHYELNESPRFSFSFGNILVLCFWLALVFLLGTAIVLPILAWLKRLIFNH